MKFLKLSFVAILISFLVVACGTMTSGPEDVAEKYLFYLNNKDFDKAKDLCTEQSREMLEKFEQLGNLNGKVKTGEILIENIKCVINDDKAVCSFTADGETKEMLMVKVDGQWLIDFDMGEENMSDEDLGNDTLDSDTLLTTEEVKDNTKD